ncbi:stage II sporulation protein M [Intrasporangium calvum]|uniref:Stage II sporulation protein M n=1 Tax=Intrasporangium calvum TaxID=53358 RepID=A0ABT5GJI2_9MICO|nr:stage II sporulation protein M [Intrasporangium calvum]MDC5698055.1 stage II sporulation protein M [Intrasporangium calvum]
MNLDALVAAHSDQWRRLDELSRRRRLTGGQADELLDLYQQVSTHLSLIRTGEADPTLVRHLSTILSRARVTLAGQTSSTWSDLGGFFLRTFPAALYRLRRWWLLTLALNVLAAFLVAWWTIEHPQVYTSMMTREEINAYVGTDFENYYREFPHHEFATLVWVNNAWVAAQAIVFGVLGFPVVYVLWQNTMGLGIVGALMASHDRASLFFGMILPHGLLELTAVFVAGGAGLWLFWSWIDPGPRPRAVAFAEAGRTVIAIALGLVAVLLVSGLIEGFVTPSGLPTAARILIGVLAEAAFFAYVFVVGRRAFRAGATGDVSRTAVGDAAPMAG